MGCTPSHIVGESTVAINDILQDDMVIRNLSVYSSSLSEKSRQNLLFLAKITPKIAETCTSDAARESGHLELLDHRRDLRKFLRLGHADTDLAYSLQRDFECWKKEPMTFFEGLNMETGGGMEAYLTRQTGNACLLDNDEPRNRVRLRFFKVFFTEAERIYHNSGELEEHGRWDWASRGRIYDYLRVNLGTGCLFLLPIAVGDSVWERRLSAKGKEREAVVYILKELRIMQKADDIEADMLGTTILTELLRPLTSGHTASAPTSTSSRRDSALVETRLNRRSEQVYYRLPIVTQYDSPVFICVQNGDIEGMRYLWGSGSASIDAVDPYGLGLLYYSTYYCWRNCGIEASFATCKALVDAGANVEWVDDVGNSPIDTMVDLILVESAMAGQPFMPFLKELGRLFGSPADEIWTTYSCSRGFTDLHNILLRIDIRMSLEAYLTETVAKNKDSAVLQARDLTGRTALDWAVEHGWVGAVNTLIFYGADVNERRGRGLSLLHLALAGPLSGNLFSSFLEIVKTLLANGADVNAIDDEGWTPLHVAASWGSDVAVDVLRQFSGDNLLTDQRTYCCQTADQLAQNNWDGHCLAKLIVPSPF
ncbi:hypothetical protein INS49_014053 [Diaporthe citri]|uniref:uncharacterized protein n=1 Tax=Diaporthe citri TaxID=83186 RepID=UPI001C7ED1DE|nr:uncharacterized protein INS49_014053 [Diaporthe citri]KAG6358169.1 hypothetical protein INS49_014053 [Diaporthe citri]